MIILELNTTPATEEDVAIWRRVTPGRAGGLGILAHSRALKADRIDAKRMATRERARRVHLPEEPDDFFRPDPSHPAYGRI